MDIEKEKGFGLDQTGILIRDSLRMIRKTAREPLYGKMEIGTLELLSTMRDKAREK